MSIEGIRQESENYAPERAEELSKPSHKKRSGKTDGYALVMELDKAYEKGKKVDRD